MDKVFSLGALLEGGQLPFDREAAVCFGHFNTIHPGHVRYFRNARGYGPCVVVALEGDEQVPFQERSSMFSQEERAQSLAMLDLVDFIVILDRGGLDQFLALLDRPTLILGKEFEETRATKVHPAVKQVKGSGGRVIYDPGETQYSSLELFSGSSSELEERRWRAFRAALKANNFSMADVISQMDSGPRPRILVIGDTIMDRYIACDALGMSNEAPVVVVRELEARDYLGGAAIVAAHLATLGAASTFLSVTGQDSMQSIVDAKLKEFDVTPFLLVDEDRPTTLKIRYMVDSQKLFRVSRLKEHSLAREIEEELIVQVRSEAANSDAILVSDFVYGVITPRVLEAARIAARDNGIPIFGDLQCSSQVGSILKFKQFSLICPTEREARIALGNHDDGLEFLANLLIEKTKSRNTILKLGGEGFIAYEESGGEGRFFKRQHFPALSVNPVDVTGAGDALLAAMAMGLTKGLTLMQSCALATCVSAIAVQTLGNEPITSGQVKQFLMKSKNSGLLDGI